jgi:drug/metabolite transporter (DMT)-like permease
MGYLFFSILLYALNNVLWKRSLENGSVSFLMAYRAVFTSLITAVCIVVLDIEWISNAELWRISTGSFIGVIGLICMLLVIKRASLQWVGIYNLLGVFFATVYLVFVKHISVYVSLVGGFIIIVGFVVFLLASGKSQLKITVREHMLLLIMTLSFSSGSIIQWENLTADISPLLIIANQELMVLFLGIVLVLRQRKNMDVIGQSKIFFKPVVLMSIVILLASFLGLLGLKITDPFKSSLLYLALPLTTILFSFIFFKEKLIWKNIVAIVLIALGAFLLHYSDRW